MSYGYVWLSPSNSSLVLLDNSEVHYVLIASDGTRYWYFEPRCSAEDVNEKGMSPLHFSVAAGQSLGALAC